MSEHPRKDGHLILNLREGHEIMVGDIRFTIVKATGSWAKVSIKAPHTYIISRIPLTTKPPKEVKK